MRVNQDDRAFRYCDIFPEIGQGDINVSICAPGTICAWHRHQRQSDYWIVLKGSLKVGTWKDGEEPKYQVLSDRNPEVVKIEPGIWHGYKNFTNEPVILLYHITNKYDGTDEERREASPCQWGREIK